jgi:hypothetical protein
MVCTYFFRPDVLYHRAKSPLDRSTSLRRTLSKKLSIEGRMDGSRSLLDLFDSELYCIYVPLITFVEMEHLRYGWMRDGLWMR